MATPQKKYRFRKCSDVRSEYPVFELLDGNVILMDIGLSDSGVLQVAFHEGIANRILESEELIRILEEGRSLASAD